MRRLVIAAALLVAACRSGQRPPPAEEPPAARHLRICRVDAPASLDPAHATSVAETALIAELFDGLAEIDPRGLPAPSLAERWEPSEDARRWTFHLRRDARWSSGRPIVADDFLFQLARLLHPATGSRHNETVDRIRGARAHREALAAAPPPLDLASLTLPASVGATAPDPHTLVIEFEHPTPLAPWYMTSSALRPTPPEAVAAAPAAWTEPGRIVTSGPFTLASRADDHVALARSTSFWGRDAVHLDRVSVAVVADQEDVLARVRRGDCDLGHGIPDAATGPDIDTAPYSGVYFYLLNVEELPHPALRRALARSIDRDAVAALARGGATSSFVPAPPRASGPCPGDGGRGLPVTEDRCYEPAAGLSFAPERARAELAIARRELGAAFPERVELQFNEHPSTHGAVAAQVAAGWRTHLGLEIELREREFKRFLVDTRKGLYQVARLGWIATVPDPGGSFLMLFRCDSHDNRSGWCDPAYDELLDRARAEPELDARHALHRRAEARLLEAAPVIPLYVYQQRRARAAHVRGLPLHFASPGPGPLRHARLEP